MDNEKFKDWRQRLKIIEQEMLVEDSRTLQQMNFYDETIEIRHFLGMAIDQLSSRYGMVKVPISTQIKPGQIIPYNLRCFVKGLETQCKVNMNRLTSDQILVQQVRQTTYSQGTSINHKVSLDRVFLETRISESS